MENNKKEIKIDIEVLKKMLLTHIKKLVTAYRIENKCSDQEAKDRIAYLLKQVIYILTNDENDKIDLPKKT